jgi:hypothetical protein
MAIVFLDLDGTMLDSGKPAENIIDALQKLKNNGHTPIIASGRIPRLLYGMDKQLGIDSYICANGNYINYQGHVVYEHYIPQETVERMIRICAKLQIDITFEGVDFFTASSKHSELVDQFSHAFGIEIPIVDEHFFRTNEVLAFIVYDDRYVDHLRAEFPELIFNQSSRFGFDVNLKGDLKAEGIRWLIKYLDYPEDEVYAIGDGYNDISMIRAVKHGIAMGNAASEVKDVASYVTRSVTEDGVPHALRHFGLITH